MKSHRRKRHIKRNSRKTRRNRYGGSTPPTKTKAKSLKIMNAIKLDSRLATLTPKERELVRNAVGITENGKPISEAVMRHIALTGPSYAARRMRELERKEREAEINFHTSSKSKRK